MMQIYQKKAYTDINPQEKKKKGGKREASDKYNICRCGNIAHNFLRQTYMCTMEDTKTILLNV